MLLKSTKFLEIYLKNYQLKWHEKCLKCWKNYSKFHENCIENTRKTFELKIP